MSRAGLRVEFAACLCGNKFLLKISNDERREFVKQVQRGNLLNLRGDSVGRDAHTVLMMMVRMRFEFVGAVGPGRMFMSVADGFDDVRIFATTSGEHEQAVVGRNGSQTGGGQQ